MVAGFHRRTAMRDGQTCGCAFGLNAVSIARHIVRKQMPSCRPAPTVCAGKCCTARSCLALRSPPDRPVAVGCLGHYGLGIEQAARRRLPAQLLNARQSAAFYLRDFSTSNASWWNGGDCSELSLHGGNGMPSALGADVGSAVVSYGAATGKEESEAVRTVAAARAVGAEVYDAGGSWRPERSSSRSHSLRTSSIFLRCRRIGSWI